MGLVWGLECMGQRNTHRHIIPNVQLFCDSSVVAGGQDAALGASLCQLLCLKDTGSLHSVLH